MIRHCISVTALIAATPLAAQTTTQDALDERYDRALAAGYKALFLCSAIANAERNCTERSPESVEQWELSGIQEPLDTIIGSLEAEIGRDEAAGRIRQVSVTWADDMPPRIARHGYPNGCVLEFIGLAEEIRSPSHSRPPPPAGSWWEIQRQNPVLEAAAAKAFTDDYGTGARTTAVAIAQDGELVEERYVPGFTSRTPQRTWSVAKSIAATLVGIGVQKGGVDVSKPAGLGDTPTDPRRKITIDNLLRMASGRYGDVPGNRTDPLYFGGSSVAETALAAPLVNQPGTVFRYANNDTLAAFWSAKTKAQINPDYDLFEKIGMVDTVAEMDRRGDYVLSSQAWSTARDLVKLGQLYLNRGVWNGVQVVPENWLDYVSTPSGPQPDGPFGYGAGFWLLNKSEGVPADTIAAMGNRGQYVVIVPSRNVVIVRRGEDPVGSRFDIAAFTKDVLENMSE